MFPCKIGTGIPARSCKEPRCPLGSCRGGQFSRQDPFLGKSSGKDIPCILARNLPRNLYLLVSRQKSLFHDPSQNPAGKQNLGSIPGENLILTEIKFLHRNSQQTFQWLRCKSRRGYVKPFLENNYFMFYPGSKWHSKTVVSDHEPYLGKVFILLRIHLKVWHVETSTEGEIPPVFRNRSFIITCGGGRGQRILGIIGFLG